MTEEINIIKLEGVNSFLLRGKLGYVLIDTGMPSQWDELISELRRLGCEPEELGLIILTHGDFDHSGNCAKLQKVYHVKIAMHQADVQIVTEGVPVKHKTEKIIAKIIQWVGRLSQKNAQFETFHPDFYLSDAQRLYDYGLSATVLHTPGHTSGSIAIVTESGKIFAGDTISNRIKPGIAPFAQDFNAVRKSIEKLKQIDKTVVYPGHGNPLTLEEFETI